MSLPGRRAATPQAEDLRRALGGSRYSADVAPQGAGWVSFVRSAQAHATVEVNLSACREVPGVLAAYTAADLAAPGRSHPLSGPSPPLVPSHPAMARPWLAGPKVRFVGEPVAAVVASSAAAAADAVELAEVGYVSRPAVVAPEAALGGEVLLFEEAGTNVVATWPLPEDPGFFHGCEVVIRQRIVNQRVAHCAMEPRAATAAWGADGTVEIHCATQNPAAFRSVAASVLGIAPEQVRVVCVDMGGAFGSKINPYPEELLVAWLAREAGRPLRWCESRWETMAAGAHGRAQIQDVELGGTREGRLLAYRLSVVQDCGAYPADAVTLPMLTRMMASGPYDIAKVAFGATAVLTNTAPVRSYRGSGRPEATAALERAVDLFASEVGICPLRLRRMNLVPAARMPWTAPSGATYDGGDYPAALDALAAEGGYETLRRRQAQLRSAGNRRQLGIGVAAYCEVTNPIGAPERAEAWVSSPSTVTVAVGTGPSGQGHAYALGALAAGELGLDPSCVEVLCGDTATCPPGGGTFGSRSVQSSGPAVVEACRDLLAVLREAAAEALGVRPAALVQDGAGFAEAGSGRRIAWADLQGRGAGSWSGRGSTYSFGAHLAVVELDVETFGVQLSEYLALDDAGRILDPLRARGQIHGGVAQGVGQALMEQLSYDAAGMPQQRGFSDYFVPTAADLPFIRTIASETPTERNPLGVKGVGESGAIASAVAVQNAVIDALAPMGVAHVDMPLSPERIWRAVSGLGGALR